jgi:hypothetical protein
VNEANSTVVENNMKGVQEPFDLLRLKIEPVPHTHWASALPLSCIPSLTKQLLSPRRGSLDKNTEGMKAMV